MDKFEMNALISKVNWHNKQCNELMAVIYDGTLDEVVFERRHRDNLEFGIDMCCEMRSAGFDAYVDRLTGAVVSGRQVDLTEEIEGEGLRYSSFEWAEDEADV